MTKLKIDWQKINGTLFANVGFGILDTKGREVGVRLHIDPKGEIYEGAIDEACTKHKYRKAITVQIQSARDGDKFGAHNCAKHEHPTCEAAKLDAAKRAEVSYKRVAAKAAKNGGVYE